MISNWSQVEKATQAAYDAEGTAVKENEIYMDSLQGRLDSLKAVWQAFSADFLNSSFLKAGVSGATEILNVLDKIQNSIGSLGMIGVTGGLVAFIKNIEKLKTLGEVSKASSVIKDMVKAANGVTSAIDFGKMASGLSQYEIGVVAAAASTANLNTQQTALLFTSSGLTPSMTASAMATAGYDASATMATMTTMKFTDEEIKAAMASAGFSSAEIATATSTTALGGSMVGASASVNTFTASITAAARGLLTFLMTNPIGWAISAGAAIFATVKIIDAFTTSMDEAVDRAENARKAYTDAQTEVESVKNKQTNLRSQLESLAGKYNIEVTDNDSIDSIVNKLKGISGELESGDLATINNIKSQNDLLETQLTLKQKIANYEQQNAAKQAQEVFKTEKGQTVGGGDGTSETEYKKETIVQTTARKKEELDKVEKELAIANSVHSRTEKTEPSKWWQEATKWEKEEKNIAQLEKQRDGLTKDISENMEVISDNYQSLVDENGNPLKGFEETAKEVGDFLQNVMGVGNEVEQVTKKVEEASQGYVSGLSTAIENSTKFKTRLDAITTAINAQATGKTLSLDTYNSEDLRDYSDALEYHNGVMQYNIDKVKEITKAKYEEEKANIANSKAMDQEQYLENARQIQALREKQTKVSDQERAYIEGQIQSLLKENSTLVENCKQYDILSASIDQATSAYQNWINAQSATQSGEMFDSSLTAFKKINDTLNKADSDDYGRVGNADYKAAVEFIVPDKVSKKGEEAINSYIESVKKYLTFDDKGEADGMNIQQFCQDALDKGLMQISKDGKSYEIAGKQTMEQFADGMGLALPLVQAMFGEMEEFGGEFDWSDEAVKSFGDLAMKANESAEALRGVKEFSDIDFVLDVSGFEDQEKALSTIGTQVDQLKAKLKDNADGKIHLDSSEVEQAQDVITYLIAQKQLITEPVVMGVDTSKVVGDVGEAIALIQQFQDALNEKEMQAAIGADTSEADSKIATLVGQIQGMSADVKATLSLDDTSAETITSSISAITPELLVKAGVDKSLVEAYQSEEHSSKGTVTWDNNKSAVDSYAGTTKQATGYVIWQNNTVNVKTSFEATGTIHWSGSQSVNGTAHVRGTAYAGGNWGTAPGGTTLVGELG